MLNRRELLLGSMALAAPSVLPFGACAHVATSTEQFQVHAWQRDERNPILPPGPAVFDMACCMNPFVLKQGDEYCLFYAGGDKQGKRRICLATAPVDDLRSWKRHGPVLDLGGKGSFDEMWCVLPCIHRINERWHLFYTGRSADKGTGLQSFRGIGHAQSNDLRNWKKVSDEPVLLGDGFPQWPDNRGIAGGGSIVELSDGPQKHYRMHYTLATGTPSKDLRVDQAKQSVIAHSTDGIHWTDKRVVLQPRPDVAYENAATIALNVWKMKTRYRAIYAAIGTQFGAYSICEAVSDDGLTWQRGAPGENLALAPTGKGWESKMVEYPHVVPEANGQLRLFYCGNGYGATGIGTATAPMLD